VAVALVAAVLAAFIIALVLDIRSGGGGPPGRVEDVDVGSAGQHTEAAVDYDQSPRPAESTTRSGRMRASTTSRCPMRPRCTP
jgi:hypothetical protein